LPPTWLTDTLQLRVPRRLEEIVMAMKVHNDVLPFWTGVDATLLTRR